MGRQHFLHIGVKPHVVGGVRQKSAFRIQLLHELQCLLQIEMGIVLIVVQRIDYQQIQILKKFHFRIGHKTRIGDIRKRTYAITEDGERQMADLNRLNFNILDMKFFHLEK